jgi:hypothetical protein
MAEWIAVAAMVTGTAMSVRNQYQQGKESKKLYEQRAAAALKDAEAVKKSYGEQARQKRKEGKRYKARQRAMFAKEGIKPAGTALDIMKETAMEFEREAGLVAEYGSTEASRLTTEAGFERQMGQSAYRSGIWGAGATAMSGIGTLGLYGAERGWWNKAPSPSATGRETIAWSGYKPRVKRTSFRGL